MHATPCCCRINYVGFAQQTRKLWVCLDCCCFPKNFRGSRAKTRSNSKVKRWVYAQGISGNWKIFQLACATAKSCCLAVYGWTDSFWRTAMGSAPFKGRIIISETRSTFWRCFGRYQRPSVRHVQALKPISPVIDADYFGEYFMLRSTIIAI